MEEPKLTQLEGEVQTLRAQREEVSVKLALKEAELATTRDAYAALEAKAAELDALAKEFASAKDKAAVIKKAEKVSVDEKDADSAKYYVKVMTKASDAADFVTKETARLKKMMDDGSVKAEKKSQFGRRLNMLSSFA